MAHPTKRSERRDDLDEHLICFAAALSTRSKANSVVAWWGAPLDKVCICDRHASPVFHRRRMDRTPLQTTETLRKFTDLRNLTHKIWVHIPEAEKNVSGDRSTQCRGGCLESKHVAVNRLISSSVTSSAEGWSAKRSTDSSEASDARNSSRRGCAAAYDAAPVNPLPHLAMMIYQKPRASSTTTAGHAAATPESFS